MDGEKTEYLKHLLLLKRVGFSSLHPHGGSQTSIMPLVRGLMVLLASEGFSIYVVHIHTLRCTNTHKINTKKYFQAGCW